MRLPAPAAFADPRGFYDAVWASFLIFLLSDALALGLAPLVTLSPDLDRQSSRLTLPAYLAKEKSNGAIFPWFAVTVLDNRPCSTPWCYITPSPSPAATMTTDYSDSYYYNYSSSQDYIA